MKKNYSLVIFLVGILIFSTSCKDQKTYSDYLKDESRAISLFISKNNIDVLKRFPPDGEFDDNEFYEDPETGVYYHIVDYGDTTEVITPNETIYVRFTGLKYFMIDDSASYNNLNPNNSYYASEITYIGPVNSNTRSFYENPGWVVPLTRVGHNGVVKMIVPFTMGSSTDRSQYQPTYYDHIEYRFDSRKW